MIQNARTGISPVPNNKRKITCAADGHQRLQRFRQLVEYHFLGEIQILTLKAFFIKGPCW
jgi:hypothetical protein